MTESSGLNHCGEFPIPGNRCIRIIENHRCTKSGPKGVRMIPFVSQLWTAIEVHVGDNFMFNMNESSRMSDDEHERPRKANGRGLNCFGLLLLISSSSILFTPLLENFPSIAPNGWEILIWLAWGYAIFAYSIILLIVNNVFRFLERKKANLSPSPAESTLAQKSQNPRNEFTSLVCSHCCFMEYTCLDST